MYIQCQACQATNDGFCQHCPEQQQIGSLEHLLINCSAFNSVRNNFFQMLNDNKDIYQEAKDIIFETLSSHTSIEQKVQLLLDSSCILAVITASQKKPNILNQIFKFSCMWCYGIHKRRLKLSGRWKKHNSI